MKNDSVLGRGSMVLWILLLWYCSARLLQLVPDKVPALFIVVSHVMPPALFAFFHGIRIYGARTLWVFIALCVGIGGIFESLSLRTGFPFGHYYFTDLMGPKIFQLPILLALAYAGMGYLSWIVSLIGLKYVGRELSGHRLFVLPLAASLVMTTWDIAMEPVWADIDRGWVWKDGGIYFGVPVSNFLGWVFTTYCFYQLFALYVRNRSVGDKAGPRFWNLALMFYLASAVGNLFIKVPLSLGPIFFDATGHQWNFASILWVSHLASILLMAVLPLAAWYRGVASLSEAHTVKPL